MALKREVSKLADSEIESSSLMFEFKLSALLKVVVNNPCLLLDAIVVFVF